MRAVAESDSPLDAAEREMLSAAQRVFGTQIDIDTLPPITPAETAAALSDPQLHWQLAHGLIVLLEGKATFANLELRPCACLIAFIPAEHLAISFQGSSIVLKIFASPAKPEMCTAQPLALRKG